jgi:hypothetical protein
MGCELRAASVVITDPVKESIAPDIFQIATKAIHRHFQQDD